MKPFSAVLLAGGRSTRMGRDKALLPLPDGRRLWQRQLSLLEELEPAEIFFSGPPRDGLPVHLRVVADHGNLGPLAGIVAALEAMSASLLVALAIDLPAMSAVFLADLIERGGAVVPCSEGRLEPLAATYPRAGLPIARSCLAGTDRSLNNFVRQLQAASLVEILDVPPAQDPLFVNWNTPADYNFQRPA